MRQKWLVIPCLLPGLVLGITYSNRAIGVERGVKGQPPAASSIRDSKVTAAEKNSGAGEVKTGRIREGSKLVDQIGEFQKSGEQINFFAKEGPLHVLENLALERVLRALDDNPTMRVWSVSGMITEYRGENYLLLTRAVLKAQPKSGPAGSHPRSESADKKEE